MGSWFQEWTDDWRACQRMHEKEYVVCGSRGVKMSVLYGVLGSVVESMEEGVLGVCLEVN